MIGHSIRWFWWFLRSPRRIAFGFGPDASRNWEIAMDPMVKEREPKRGEGAAA